MTHTNCLSTLLKVIISFKGAYINERNPWPPLQWNTENAGLIRAWIPQVHTQGKIYKETSPAEVK